MSRDQPAGQGPFAAGDRAALRTFYREAWRKRRLGLPAEPLEALIADVVEAHPEYHGLFGQEDVIEMEFSPELGQTNPFLHMALHLALREQLTTDRPPGIRRAYETLARRLGDPHAVEHALMECLATALWEAQRSGQPADEAGYMDCVERVAGRRKGVR